MAKRLLQYDEVTLPSGTRIRGVRPTAQELIRRGLWPGDLRLAAMLTGEATVTADSSPDEQALFVESQHVSIAAYIRSEQDPDSGAWETVRYSPGEVHDFPAQDLDALEDIILRHRTPEQVTAASTATDPDEQAAVDEQEAADTVDGWAGFRPDGGSAAPGADGADLVDAAIAAPRDPGRRRSARARRGAGDPAGASR